MLSISVIIPVYNAQATLRQCVDSILLQKNECFELILVDDGSTDDSSEICDEYREKDPRVIVIHKQNGGVSSARNVALDIAKGEWITFVDSDDYLSNDFCSNVVDLEEDLVVKSYHTFFRGVETNEDIHIPFGKYLDNKSIARIIDEYVASQHLRTPWGKFFKRQIMNKLRFPESMKVGEDSWFVQNYLSRIQSLRVMSSGYYVIRISDMTSGIKYGMTVDYAKSSLRQLFCSYTTMQKSYNISARGFLSFLGYFKLVSKNDWKRHPYRWYDDSEIDSYYQFVWQYLNWKNKLSWKILRYLMKLFQFHLI